MTVNQKEDSFQCELTTEKRQLITVIIHEDEKKTQQQAIALLENATTHNIDVDIYSQRNYLYISEGNDERYQVTGTINYPHF